MNIRNLLTATLIIFAGQLYGQSIDLTPVLFNPNIFYITVTTPGNNAVNPMTDYTEQKINYAWPKGIYPGEGIISVSSSTIPTGISVTISASSTVEYSGGKVFNPGLLNGTVTVGPTPQPLVHGIWGTTQNNVMIVVSRALTQNIIISDFSQLHPGIYNVTYNYRLGL